MNIQRLPIKGLAALAATFGAGFLYVYLDIHTEVANNTVFAAVYFAVMVTLFIYAYAEIMKKIGYWVNLLLFLGVGMLNFINDKHYLVGMAICMITFFAVVVLAAFSSSNKIRRKAKSKSS